MGDERAASEGGSEARMTREQVRAFDERAIREFGIPGAVLMENAGRQAAERLLAALRVQALAGRRGGPPWRIAVVCGRGNNGGDGYVVARHARNAGHEVECFSTCDASQLSGDAALNRSIVERLGIPVLRIATAAELADAIRSWERADALVDALLGTGAKGAPRGETAAALRALETVRGPFRLALDVPSGLDADLGTVDGECFSADLTVTFVARKPGFDPESSRRYTGEVVVADIGIAPEVLARRAVSKT
jgi:NAD(P)H-hydrate epimerase